MTPNEMNRFAAEKIMGWTRRPDHGYQEREWNWNPHGNRDMADMVLEKFWDVVEYIVFRREKENRWEAGTEECSGYHLIEVESNTESSVRLKLAIAIYEWMEAHEPERLERLLK